MWLPCCPRDCGLYTVSNAGITKKHRVHRTLEGKVIDRNPVAVPYTNLYYQDHFVELTGKPLWQRCKWLLSDPDEYIKVLKIMVDRVPFELLWAVHKTKSRVYRGKVVFVKRKGKVFLHELNNNKWEQADNYDFYSDWNRVNETQFVFDRRDINERIRLVTAQQMIAKGHNDYLDATVNSFGSDYFIVSGGVVGVIYASHFHVGMTNIFSLMIDQPDFLDYLCKKILENNVEDIRRIASSGGDAITIDDAMATSDLISVNIMNGLVCLI